jgi:phosphatidate cytidylyltransferase
MLKQRIITAAILIPLVVWGTLSASTPVFAVVTGIFVVIGAWEWAGLCGWQDWKWRFGYALVFGLILLLTCLSLRTDIGVAVFVLLMACFWWLFALGWLILYQYKDFDLLTFPSYVKAIQGLLILIPAWFALCLLHGISKGQLVIFLFVLIWVADSAAYFVGRQWGTTKLADKISPGKTWEGVLGGLLMSVGLAWVYIASTSPFSIEIQFGFVLLCVLTVIASIIGDLVESLFKRQAGVKDSSQLLPGHGGVLDRIDSLTAATPVFAVGVGIFMGILL